MKVRRTKADGVVSFIITSDRSWLVVITKAAFMTAAAIAVRLGMSWWIDVFFILIALMMRSQISEGVLAIEGLGLQLEKKGRVMFWSDENKFFAKHSIMGVLINEVFEGFQVNYVLQIVIKHTGEMSLVFPQMRPGLPVVREVWQNLDAISPRSAIE